MCSCSPPPCSLAIRVVVRLVYEDHIEKVRAQIAQPAVVFPRELLNIRDRNMAMQLAITATSGKS